MSDPVCAIKSIMWRGTRGSLDSLDALLAPCVGHVFKLQPPQPELEAIVARAQGWGNERWEQRGRTHYQSRVFCAPTEPFIDGDTDETGDRVEWPTWPYAKPEPQLGEDHHAPHGFLGTLQRVVKERPIFEVGEFWEVWWFLKEELWDRDFSTVPDELRERLRREIDPERWRALRPKWGDQLEDSLAASLAEIGTGYRGVLEYNLKQTLRYAVAFTALAVEPEASWLEASLHELWLRGNFPLHADEDGRAVLLCQSNQEVRP